MSLPKQAVQRHQKILLLLALKSATTIKAEVIKELSKLLNLPTPLIKQDIALLVSKGLLTQEKNRIQLSAIALSEDA